MAVEQEAFEWVLSGDGEGRQFRAFVANGGGRRAAAHVFEWRTDSTELALTLGALARAALAGQPPEDDLHVRFGRRLFETEFAGPVATGPDWRILPGV